MQLPSHCYHQLVSHNTRRERKFGYTPNKSWNSSEHAGQRWDLVALLCQNQGKLTKRVTKDSCDDVQVSAKNATFGAFSTSNQKEEKCQLSVWGQSKGFWVPVCRVERQFSSVTAEIRESG
jgi:hypothetical protein